MTLKEVAKEECETKDELLTGIIRVCICLGDVCVGRYHSVNGRHDHLEEGDEFWVIFRTNVESSNFSETFQGEVAEVRCFEKLSERD